MSPQKIIDQDPQLANRIAAYGSIASELALLSDQRLSGLLSKGTSLGTSIGGTSSLIEICGSPVFVKKIRLADIERQPQNRMSTRNLFELPTYLQYGIGSTGFGTWRELAAHAMSTNWVLTGQCQNFPLMYHWRELPGTRPTPIAAEEFEKIERDVEFWGGSDAVRERLKSSLQASTEIVLFLEYFPENLHVWLRKKFADGASTQESACKMVENNLRAITSFINSRYFQHFDAHFENILTDGTQLYLADFGLATCSKFELSEAELIFLKEHHNYDRCYTTAYMVKWVLAELFGVGNYEKILREIVSGENARFLPPGISLMIEKYAPMALVMNDFFEKLKNESKLTPYPAMDLELLF